MGHLSFEVRRAGKKHAGAPPETVRVEDHFDLRGPAHAAEEAKRIFRKQHRLAPQVELVCIPLDRPEDTPRAKLKSGTTEPHPANTALDRLFAASMGRLMASAAVASGRLVRVRIAQSLMLGGLPVDMEHRGAGIRYSPSVLASPQELDALVDDLKSLLSAALPQELFDVFVKVARQESEEDAGLALRLVQESHYGYQLQVERDGEWVTEREFESTRDDWPVGHARHKAAAPA